MERAVDEIFAEIRRLCSGDWQLIRDIDRLEAAVLVERRRVPAFNSILLTEKASLGCYGRLAKVRNGELFPLRSYLRALGAPTTTRFRFIDTPSHRSKIDVQVRLNQVVKNLQITQAIPSVLQSNDGAKHGKQYRLHMADLAANGFSIGFGPYEKNVDGEYVKVERCNDGDELRNAVRQALARAIEAKRPNGLADTSLLIYGVEFGRFGIEIFDEFQLLLEAEMANSNFAEIILVCDSPVRIFKAVA